MHRSPDKPPTFKLYTIVTPKHVTASAPKRTSRMTQSMFDSELNITGTLCDVRYRYDRLYRRQFLPVIDAHIQPAEKRDLFTNPVIRSYLNDRPVVKLPRLSH